MATAEDSSAPLPTWTTPALVAVALCGLALRVAPFLGAGGPLGFPVDYDPGVYFSASALLWKGVLPYRDFVFVHPPGLLYFLGLTSAFAGTFDVGNAFAAARVVAAVVGAANVFLTGRLASRAAGPLAGLVAAALYATYPEAVVVERGPYLEPVLNLACLALATAWLSGGTERRRAPWVAGALSGAALAVKVWGGLWLLAALASVPRGRVRAELPKFLAAAVAVGLALVAPLALAAPRAFVEQTLLFHAWRPPDGGVLRLARLAEVLNPRHLVASMLALAGVAHLVVRATQGGLGALTRAQRFFGAAWLLTLVAFFASSAYWNQYNAHLAVSECVLAGLGAMALWNLVEANLPGKGRVAAMALAAAVAAFPSFRRCVLSARGRAPELVALGEGLRARVPAGACLLAFEPAWGLVGGRLPSAVAGSPVLVDTYAAMLLPAVSSGARFADAGAAFQSPSSQPGVRAALEACRYAVLGWRGGWQLAADTRTWFDAHYTPRELPGASGLELWERTSP